MDICDPGDGGRLTPEFLREILDEAWEQRDRVVPDGPIQTPGVVPRIHVDFNGLQDDGCLIALRRHADRPSAVVPGTRVVLWDEEGNTAAGRILELGQREQLRIQVELRTWRAGA